MNKDLFDTKIAELLEQNENLLPNFDNKESVWENIERRMQKSRRVKIFRYAALIAAACIVPIVGFMFLHRTDRPEINKTETAKVVPQQPGLTEYVQEIYESEESDVNATIDDAVSGKKNVSIAGKKNQIVPEPEKEMNAVDDVLTDVLNPIIEEKPAELPEKIENPVYASNDLSVANRQNEIQVRVSLSPGNRENKKSDKIKLKFSPGYFANNEDNASKENIEGNRMSGGLIRIPL